MKKPSLLLLLVAVCSMLSPNLLSASTTTFWTGAVDGDLGNSNNWSPITNPYTPPSDSDLIFSSSTNTNLTGILPIIYVSSLTFNANAPSYTFHVPYAQGFTIDGGGIVNNSGVTQTLSIDAGNVTFNNSPTLTGATIAVNGSTSNNNYGALYLFGTTSAGNSTIINNAGTIAGGGGGFTIIGNTTTLSNATVINNGGVGQNGYITINGSAGNATLIANGGASTNQSGGVIDFQGGTGANATITVNGGSGSNALAGGIAFQYNSSAGSATVTLNGGTNGGAGAYALFENTASGGTSKFVVNSHATLDISQVDYTNTVSFGSVEGAGTIDLGGRKIQIGSLNTSTSISGLISDAGLGGQTGGSLEKIGSGTLNLLNNDTYTGGTIITAGALAVNGSIQGSTEVKNGATLKGTGTIYGTVTVDAGGTISPGNSPGTITMRSLILTNTSILDFELGTTSDKVVITTSGGLTLAGILNISDSGGFNTNAPYVLFNYTGPVTNNGLQIGTVPAGYLASDFSFSLTNGQINFLYSPVPEPTTVVQFFLSAMLLVPLLLRRRIPLGRNA